MKRVVYYTDEQLQGLNWVARMIDFGVSLTNHVAINEVYTAHLKLRERRDLYKREVKKAANDAVRRMEAKRGRMLALMANRKFFDTYNDRVIDLAANDVTLFRLSIQQTLRQANCDNDELLAYMETARDLLKTATIQFNGVCEEAEKKYGKYPYAEVFCEFDMSDVLKSWERVYKLLDNTSTNVDLNTTQSQGLFENLRRRLEGGEYIEECLKAAHDEVPEFVENHILVKDE